jgi:hypothetical protein
MRRLIRTAAAALVAMAVAGLPVVRDNCGDACIMHKAGPATPPTCHHAASASTHVGAVPVPCGHDHRVVVAAAAARIVGSESASVTAIIPIARQPLAAVVIAGRFLLGSPPAHGATARRSTLPLRV